MSFIVKASLSNIRTPKTTTPELVTAPTHGQVKLNQPASRALGMRAGDYLNFVEGEVNGQTAFFITKGSKGVGSKLASVGENGSGTLSFGSASVWENLQGSTSEKKVYTVDVENPQEDEQGNKYYGLTFARTEAKSERKAKAVSAE